jgi:hypothetical protein
VIAPRPGLVAALAVSLVPVLVAAGCSGDDDSDATDPTDAVSATSPPAALSDLVELGASTCEDTEGDVTVSARSVVEPAVPLPGLDMLEASSTLNDDELTATFVLAGPPDPATDPEYVLFIGLVDDLNGFEVQVSRADDTWIAELATRGRGINEARAIPTAVVDVEGSEVRVTVPRIDAPSVGPNQPVAYGTSGLVTADGKAYDTEGEDVGSVSAAARAFEECLGFGQ